MTKSDPKAEVRKAAFARRKAAHDTTRGAEAAARLLEVLRPFEGKVIAGYMPIRSEVSPLPAMVAMTGHATITVPVIQGDGLPLIFREWCPGCDMIDGPFGALVPAEGDFLDPDVLIVPMVAFDRSGGRMGYGGGFYDRSLEELRAKKDVLAIGFAYGAQECETLPLEPTDQPLDMIVTEAEVLRFP